MDRWMIALAAAALSAGTAVADGAANPSDAQKKPEEAKTKEEPRKHSWELPPVVVREKKWTELKEEELVGDYAQPRWTAHRRFPETRVYVIPPGQVEFEYWQVHKIPRRGSTETERQYEIELGLPHRFQLDLYVVSHQTGNEGASVFDEQKAELRWAPADWGKIWGNPALYAEWKALSNEPDHVEGKLLLGDEIAPRWHWGLNYVFEYQTGGAYENTHELTGGLSYTLLDEKFSTGAEVKFGMTDERGQRGNLGSNSNNFEKELLVGPSFQFRPVPQAHIDFAPLFGVTSDSPRAKIMVVLGWEF